MGDCTLTVIAIYDALLYNFMKKFTCGFLKTLPHTNLLYCGGDYYQHISNIIYQLQESWHA